MERMDGLRAQVMQNESNIEELKLACESIKKSIEICQNQILEAGGTRFKAQRSIVNDLKDQIKLQEKRSSKLSAQKSSLEKQISTGIGNSNSIEISNFEAELKGVEDLIENLTIEAFKVKQEHENLIKSSEDLNENILAFRRDQDIINRELAKFRKKEFEFKKEIEEILEEISESKKKISNFENLLKKLEINSIKIEGEIDEEIPIFSFEELADRRGADNNKNSNPNNHVTNLEQGIKLLEEELSSMRPNLKVIQEYRERERIYKQQKEELEEIERKRDEHRFNYENLRKLRYEEFMNGFRQISLRLKELYQLITMGGNAELELVDSLDPFSEGILFSVMPPKKSWKNISNLSGGEKTLSSLALVFALHTFKPTPIYVMDEIDAALDFRNVSIVANYLKERTKDAQFIVISLRNNMFELADRLVGIYKTNQRTKSVTIDPNTFCIKSQ
jgi:structural maintenance of chromosome 4